MIRSIVLFSHDSPRRGSGLRLALPLALVVVLVAMQPVYGGTKVLPKGKKTKPTNLQQILRAGAFSSAQEQKDFDDYFNITFYPEVTQCPRFPAKPPQGFNENFDPVKTLRGYLDLASKADSQDVYDDLSKLTLSFMDTVAKDDDFENYARVTAVLMMAEVNKPQATNQLLGLIKTQSQTAEALRVFALIGIRQQARQGWITDPAVAKNVVKFMVVLLTYPKFALAPGPNLDGACWMDGLAAEILGLMKTTADGSSVEAVPKALLKMVLNDPKDVQMGGHLMLSQRCQAAKALSQLNYVNPIDTQPYVTALTILARDILKSPHAANANDLLARRFLLASLRNVQAAFNVLEGISQGAAKKQAAEVGAGLKQDCDALDRNKPNAAAIKTMVEQRLQAIEKYIPK